MSSTAVRDLERIPARYLEAVLAFIYGPLAENPHRVGKELGRELAGLHSARRGAYRVLYEVAGGDDPRVLIHRVDHRAHVYRPR